MSNFKLEFELPLKEIEDKINNLLISSDSTGIDVSESISELEKKLKEKKKEIYSNLTRWQKVQLARHANRPYSIDYIKLIVEDWFEIHGDRKYSDDMAIISGIGRIGDSKVMIIAQEKGRGTKNKLKHNFGMPHPEGYRKALRVMKLAEKFNIPILTLIDTPGAFPGIEAEERGQAQAIADNLFQMASLQVPIISIVIGEGASGGALAIGLADRILCMQNTWFSVISPEGCASILFRDPQMAPDAADSMKVSSQDLFDLGIADDIIPEPLGGAHSDYKGSAKILKEFFLKHLNELKVLDTKTLLNYRHLKYEKIGEWKSTDE